MAGAAAAHRTNGDRGGDGDDAGAGDDDPDSDRGLLGPLDMSLAAGDYASQETMLAEPSPSRPRSARALQFSDDTVANATPPVAGRRLARATSLIRRAPVSLPTALRPPSTGSVSSTSLRRTHTLPVPASAAVIPSGGGDDDSHDAGDGEEAMDILEVADRARTPHYFNLRAANDALNSIEPAEVRSTCAAAGCGDHGGRAECEAPARAAV